LYLRERRRRPSASAPRPSDPAPTPARLTRHAAESLPASSSTRPSPELLSREAPQADRLQPWPHPHSPCAPLRARARNASSLPYTAAASDVRATWRPPSIGRVRAHNVPESPLPGIHPRALGPSSTPAVSRSDPP